MKKIILLLTILHTINCCGVAQNSSAIKLFRFGEPSNEKPGIITTEGQMLDVSAFGEDYNENFFATNGIERLNSWLNVNKNK